VYGNVETGHAQVQTGIFHDEADYTFDSFITESSSGDLLTTSVDLTEGQGDVSLSASLYPESSTTFDIEITVDKSVVEPNIDTYFLQDLTGSFYDDLDNITTDADGNGIATLEEMVQVFEAKSGHSSYGTGTFVDTANGDGDTAHRQFLHGINVADSGDGAANAGVLQTQYDGYVASGGADYPESQFYAIKEIAEAIIKVNGGNEALGICASTDPDETFGFTAGSNPVVVLSTDAISHGYLAEDTDRFGTDPNLSGIMEMYAYVEASGMQLVVLAADLVSGNMGAVTFWNDVLNGVVGNADSGWSGAGGVYNTHESFEIGQSIQGYVAELNTDSSNIVSALQNAVDNIEFTSPLSLVTDGSSGGNETDNYSYTSLTEGTFEENPDGTFTQTWTVELQAPVGGADDSQISFVVTDGDGNPIGETVDVAVTVADGGQMTGTEHFDTLIGTDTLSDIMYGEAGDDRMDGLDGADTLNGGAGNDILVGGQGDDLLIGGLGDDVMTGAGGGDTFVFSANAGEGHDTVTDFNVATDVIRLTDVLDAEGDLDIDLDDLLQDGGQNVSASVTGADGADVELTISHGDETTVVTLTGINASHTFDGDTTLSDLINHGLQIDPM
jgi:Ca2+-binding RTX toxin-like protein